MPPTRRPRKKPVAKRRLRIGKEDDVLLRCATIERRLEAVDALFNILTQRMTALQAQVDHLAAKIRS
jgi:hypothetical protein